MSPRFLITGLLATLLSGGCGTCASFITPTGDPRTYGGVRFDIDALDKLANGQLAGSPSSEGDGKAAWIMAAALVLGPFVDLPLSFLADTLLYPLTRRLDNE